jgi:hypothetical protein
MGIDRFSEARPSAVQETARRYLDDQLGPIMRLRRLPVGTFITSHTLCRNGQDPQGRQLVAADGIQRLVLRVHLGRPKGRRPGQPLCRAHIRPCFVRAGDANRDQLTYWTQRRLERIRALYAAHGELMTAWEQVAALAPGQAAAAAARLEDARAAGDAAIETIDAALKKQMAAPGPAGVGEEGAGHAGPGAGRPDRAPGLLDDRPR